MNDPPAAVDSPALSGGCLCGQIRYRTTSPVRDGYWCHCRMCQLAFGSVAAPFINVESASVDWLAEPAWYASSRFAERAFCARCGTPLAFRYLDSDRIDLSVGSLDEPGKIAPTSHFAVESRVPGWELGPGLEEARLDAEARLAERWKGAYGDAVTPGPDAARGPDQAPRT